MIIPYGKQHISQEDIDSVVNVLKSDFLTQGPMVPLFERRVSQYCDAKFAVAANSATSALHIACMALGIQKGSLVWTSPISFVASSNCALYCGATVDFVDIDKFTYNISIENLEAKLKIAETSNSLPDLLIAVHFAGRPLEMDRIAQLGKKYKFKIIEDASHALGAIYEGQKIGSCKYSEITVFSFHPVKMITTCEGGMALTNNKTLARRMQILRTHGITSHVDEMWPSPKDEIWNYQQIELGFNLRMNDLQAALGVSQMDRLDLFLEKRRDIARNYNKLLRDLPVINPIYDDVNQSSWHLYVIELDQNRTETKQKSLYNKLRESGILVNLHYIPIYKQPFYKKMGFVNGYCPNAEKFFKRALSLPIYYGLSDEHQLRVAEALANNIILKELK